MFLLYVRKFCKPFFLVEDKVQFFKFLFVQSTKDILSELVLPGLHCTKLTMQALT